ncbi:hypothetical protein Cst_c05080 [Thermoclostridium stercorarium subsp. stercorarium DSM 8532]|uniref:Uncharacterized protein n=1 Tax=Thermoclostridium stercorarium (strain ATCC 35414 / DSM 8532 / NCIMB 11754) TaxID=1121335 RepID=L7VHK9_THES1|nr:hypothetical protein Cst_c05080 [Thermoclostridium stercorarium subsp. stercorarium DSM 8532]
MVLLRNHTDTFTVLINEVVNLAFNDIEFHFDRYPTYQI